MSIATRLTEQPWDKIGQGPDIQVAASENREVMIKQNYAVLERLLLKVISHRKSNQKSPIRRSAQSSMRRSLRFSKFLKLARKRTNMKHRVTTKNMTKMLHNVKVQLLLYIRRIADLYRDVYYHNFQHATHVTLSANKLIDMLLSCDYDSFDSKSHGENSNKNQTSSSKQGVNQSDSRNQSTAQLFERGLNSFGISKDPLMHFSLVFSALVHDVEHKGLPNAQLIKEGDKLSSVYKDKSVAEQHSTSVAFNILAEPCFKDLRGAIYTNTKEREKFRQLVIDLILCTDISSPERIERGRKKWETAFPKSPMALQESKLHRRWSDPSLPDLAKREATLTQCRRLSGNCKYSAQVPLSQLRANAVMEQIMQVADVAHLMQDWPVFLKWNKKLYDELLAANMAKRGFDPSTNWCNGQISFLDNYVIPLSKRVQESGVFGTKGTLFQKNAILNRERWIYEGEQKSKAMIKNVSYVCPNLKTNCDQCVGDDSNLHIRPLPQRMAKTNRTTRAA